MTAKLNIQCYECNTVYELEPDMIGENVECAVCGSVFVIPDFNPDDENDIVPTIDLPAEEKQTPEPEQPAPVVEEAKSAPPEEKEEPAVSSSSQRLSTATIKLNIGGGHGMIPLVDDKFGVLKAQEENGQSPEEALENFKKVKTKSSKQKPEPEPESKKKWWKLSGKKK